MLNLWTLGGLSWRELLKRAARESWQDEVFGQAARLAFYHFLALFPVLLLAATVLNRFGSTGAELQRALERSLLAVFPPRASEIVARFLVDVGNRSEGHTIWFAVFGSLWAALNGTWAVMSGLNAAYEVEEERTWWEVTITAAGLTVALAVLAFGSVGVLFFSRRAGVAVEWPVLAAVLLLAFALYYRFGPNLLDREMRWSTPGAVIAVVLWLGTSWIFRGYVTYQARRYDQVYGPVGAMAILLLWLYFTGVAILIGGEINSEIENAAVHHGRPGAERPGESRPAGISPPRK